MAEALAVIGLVSSMVTFVDFGSKVVNGAKRIRDSGEGALEDLEELAKIVEDVRRFNREAQIQLRNGHRPSSDVIRITEMVAECEKICDRIRILIQKLAVRDSSILETGRVALQAIRKKKDIQDLRTRLDALDKRIRSNIQHIFQEDRHDSVLNRLKEIELRQQEEGIKQTSNLNSVKDNIIQLINQNESWNEKQIETQKLMFADLITSLNHLREERIMALKQIEVLRSLHFPEIRRRHDQIPAAEHRTNQWIYNPTKTAFATWLESSKSDDGLFYIFGKAGSGKSTLMKQISESTDTRKRLDGSYEWTISSFYFWNQGSEMQKSELGLFQSLLYQILKTTPELAQIMSQDRLNHEVWDLKCLKAAFELITRQFKFKTRHCFFIDGLDEYEGDEFDVVGMLKTLSSSGRIKICVSSRPGRIYERFVREKILSRDRMLDIAEFTKSDMEIYVRKRLQDSDLFSEMAFPSGLKSMMHPTCQQIIVDITNRADGVWLWVFLVTRDIVRQVERDESITRLRRIVDEFPADLEKYFERIIERIDGMHKDEMAQTVLVTMDELQPLPLYAFHLLEREREDPDYALKEGLKPLREQELKPQYGRWKARVRNRCGDLLIVDDQPHPIFLSHSVDFLHRTVRDFLQDCYQTQLRSHLKRAFDPSVSLCKIYLCLLKGHPYNSFNEKRTINTIIGLTDELLYYAHEVEKRSDVKETPLVAVLDEVDRVNTSFDMAKGNHWTHARDLPYDQGSDHYFEGGNCNFLALTIQARLVKKADDHFWTTRFDRPG
ncbi:hypothetical protein E8E13_006193 [Curvularia kusanoi]|uniref:NACHT domain-containing protein n=1 Tax=Curvularia kusanoi TaxID=90978 RepID=A0A9P4W7V3_CURKU|nr:hypothetical protein E8E13_006193 [Curvularia kusanoi]